MAGPVMSPKPGQNQNTATTATWPPNWQQPGRPITLAEFQELTGVVPESRMIRGRRLWLCQPEAGQLSAELAYRRLVDAGVEAYLALVVVAAAAADPPPAPARQADGASSR